MCLAYTFKRKIAFPNQIGMNPSAQRQYAFLLLSIIIELFLPLQKPWNCMLPLTHCEIWCIVCRWKYCRSKLSVAQQWRQVSKAISGGQKLQLAWSFMISLDFKPIEQIINHISNGVEYFLTKWNCYMFHAWWWNCIGLQGFTDKIWIN